MRLRLGLLQDPAVIERQIERELREVEKQRQRDAAPTVKTEAQTKIEEEVKQKERKGVEKVVKESHKPPRIRPLSENKAIETGANFIAESFLFVVAAGLIVLEGWRRNSKEKKADADIAERLEAAERERIEMRERMESMTREIEALLEKKPFAKSAGPDATPTNSTDIKIEPRDRKLKEAQSRIPSLAQISSKDEEKTKLSSMSALNPSNWFGTGKGSSP